MKSLDLNLMGVQEMNTLEMQETDGGIIWFVVIAAAVLLGSCTVNVNTQIGGQDNVINNTQTVDSAYNGNTLDIPLDMPIGY
jgi:hypothetical protein